VFDSSQKRGQPATFPVNGVIKGWTEALQLMKEGGKWQIYLPSELAYGPEGTAAYLLGSACRGELRADSDVDIALLPLQG
jgi:FKBP-type peptidyl-prolyl cis-trans isomerase